MFFERLVPNNYPQLDWIQVEISSYCNASCIYCPHSTYRANWQNRYLSIESFRNLIPAFKKTSLVYLQGWGEPFTHPRFFEMLQIAKEAGCMVGTTTNGTLLSRGLIEKLVGQGLDIIGFSLAVVNKRNDKIRKGTQIKKVLECVDEIHRAKDKFGVDNPQIHKKHLQQNLSFGNIQNESLNSTWHHKDYQQFVREFRNRKGPAVCQNCLKRTIDIRY